MFPYRFLQSIQNNPSTFHLARVISGVLSFPISIRKIIITSCQTWEVEDIDYANTVLPDYRDFVLGHRLSKRDYLHSLRQCVSSPVQASIIWMFARTCPEPKDHDESQDVAQAGFEKELAASQTEFSNGQLVSYSAFFRSTPGFHDKSQSWVDQAHRIRDSFVKGVHGKVLYPHVNRNKNTSDETAAAYNLFSDCEYVRTVDLEVLYSFRGVQVGGNCEMRDAWKFNDLKPRIYYCIGGQQYWSSSYIKVIAVKLMESIPATNVKLRTRPDSFLTSSPNDDYVVAWDYTSFTTTLAELKHFMWYVARILEQDSVWVTLFDYRDGFHKVPLYKMIDEYNEVANMYAPFEIHRMVGKYVTENGLESTLHQINSGMLGVAGNIGFSTALHGFVVCKECGENRCVCVGDDALGITSEDPNSSLVPELRKLGGIHPEKFGIIAPGEPDGRYIKFLKRRFERDQGGFRMNYLLNVPITPYIDGNAGHRMKPHDFSLESRIFKFSSHVGSLLWEVHEHPDIPMVDIEIMFTFLRAGYKYLRLPMKGALPGTSLFGGTEDAYSIGHVIPAISGGLDPRKVDWLDFLLENSPSMFFKGSVFMLRVANVHHEWIVGECCMMNEGAHISALEDLGYVKTMAMSEWMLVTDVTSSRILRRMVRKVDDGQVKAIAVTCLRQIPSYFINTDFETEDVKSEKHLAMDI